RVSLGRERSAILFVNYTNETGGRKTVIAEYQVSGDNPNVAGRDEQVILTFGQPRSNHNGGMLEFGSDGYLYIGVGDSGGGDDPDDAAENNTVLLGSLLRIDVDNGDPYAIPSENPYADSPDGPNDPRPEIWAYGLRNPWRFSFDRQTNDLYIADVGQDAREEINIQPAASTGGENYGWDIYEGDLCNEPNQGGSCVDTGVTMPAHVYNHNNDRCSITGGYVYRGQCMPDIQGRYFYADYCSNQVFTLEYAGGEVRNNQDLNVDFGEDITSFGEDGAGEIYVVNRGGTVSRIVLASD
ncbi:MAG: PQQ-dependent sugar dehydrogenase, partial [Myxococcota bacterium]